MQTPFGTWLLNVLADKGWSQAEFTRRLSVRGVDVDRSAVSQWCSGASLPTSRRIDAILTVLGVDDPEARVAVRALGVEGQP